MTRATAGEASFSVDGVTYTLRFDFNTMVDFEDETGKPTMDLLQGMEAGEARPKDIRALFWAMLRTHHPDITQREAGRLVLDGMAALQKAVESAMPTEAAAGEAPNEGKPGAATSQAA